MAKQIKTQEPTEVDWDKYYVHPAHQYPTDEVYHDVMNALSHTEWQTPLQLAMEIKHSEKDVKKALAKMLRDDEKNGDTSLEVAVVRGTARDKCYRFEGASRREEVQ